MATSVLRSSKLQEFVAHESSVNCLALGQISGRVLVTGGDDKKVNLWAIGTTQYVLSLNAHSNPVECVKFGLTEELVCSGSQAGEINIWDLETNKKTRTFVGHNDAIRCMDFHPYGDFLTSGSLDTSIKLWDLRRRGCISSYKGHSLTVNSVRFSPDGLWLASGAEDGKVKMWDVRMGRQLRELPDHRGSVQAVEFHPHEFLLASGSADRTVHFWDLENFQLVSTTDKDKYPIRCLLFSQEGECLYAGTEDYLQVLAWEPGRTLDSVSTGWGKIQDMVRTQQQLIGASFHKSKVILQSVDLKTVKTKRDVGGATALGGGQTTPTFKHGHPTRKSFSKERLSSPRLAIKVTEDSGEDSDGSRQVSSRLAPLLQDSPAVFQPNRTLNRTPPPPEPETPEPITPEPESLLSPYETDCSLSQRFNSPTSESEPLSLSSLDSNPAAHAPQIHMATSPRSLRQSPLDARRSSLKHTGAVLPSKQPVSVVKGSWPKDTQSALLDSKTDFPLKMNNIRPSPSEGSLHRPPPRNRKNSLTTAHSEESRDVRESPRPLARGRVTPLRPVAPVRPSPAPSAPTSPVCPPSPSIEFFTSSSSSASRLAALPPDTPVYDKPSIDVDDFLPKGASSARGLGYSARSPDMSEAEVLSSVVRGHSSMMLVMTSRQRSLQVIFSLWHNKDARAAVEEAVNQGDAAVSVDLLGVLVLRPTIWSLDICGAVLPCIADLLNSKYETHMTTGCTALTLILRNFSHIIKTNVQAPIQTVGVDISREERYNKCLKCYKSLMSIRAFLLKRQTMQGRLGHSFRELLLLMEGLE